ncbi:hypothetical protein AURDEDRAFT_113498 [Auricularia subglabra TFB-10046 SS5]|nr:hypothetical protein AURDEDRAFT_113498 [Auricularia subglabra TFB-10046 SS5]
MSADILPMHETYHLDVFVDVLAPPANLPPLPPVPVPVDDDPDLRLLSAIRALTGAGELGTDDGQALCEDDVRAALEDALTMRGRFIEEHRTLCAAPSQSAAAVQRAMSALAACAWPPPPPAGAERPPKRRRVGAVPTRREQEVELPPPAPQPQRTTKLGRKRVLSPGQRKANHILSEQRRRARIREACDTLCEVVPALQAPASEEVVIQNTIEHVQGLLGKQAALLQRLQHARGQHPGIAVGSGLWERRWDGGGDGEEVEGSDASGVDD